MSSDHGDERYGCPGLVWFDAEALQCGLYSKHDGPCTPNVGDYLPPPILHPLDAWLVRVRQYATGRPCPNGHGGAWYSPFPGRRLWTDPSYGIEWTTMFRHFEDGAWLPPESEALWRFEPCGCEFREILRLERG